MNKTKKRRSQNVSAAFSILSCFEKTAQPQNTFEKFTFVSRTPSNPFAPNLT
jgi:hypothetical protein